jgi:hypothetical protein
LIGVIAAVGIIVVLVNMARKRNPTPAPVETAAAVAVTVNTTPPGAKVRINKRRKVRRVAVYIAAHACQL